MARTTSGVVLGVLSPACLVSPHVFWTRNIPLTSRPHPGAYFLASVTSDSGELSLCSTRGAGRWRMGVDMEGLAPKGDGAPLS